MAKRKKVRKKSTKDDGAELTSLQALVDMDDSEWADTPAAEGGGVPFPASRGQTALIDSADVGQSQAGNPQIKWVLKGTCDVNDGQTDFKNSMLITAQNRSFARRDLEAIGLEWPDSAAALGETVKEAEGLEVLLDVVDKDDYHNIYFRDVVGGEGGKAEESNAEDEGSYTKADLKKLGKAADKEDAEAIEELEGLAGDEEVDLDPDDYDTWSELAEEIIEVLEL